MRVQPWLNQRSTGVFLEKVDFGWLHVVPVPALTANIAGWSFIRRTKTIVSCAGCKWLGRDFAPGANGTASVAHVCTHQNQFLWLILLMGSLTYTLGLSVGVQSLILQKKCAERLIDVTAKNVALDLDCRWVNNTFIFKRFAWSEINSTSPTCGLV